MWIFQSVPSAGSLGLALRATVRPPGPGSRSETPLRSSRIPPEFGNRARPRETWLGAGVFARCVFPASRLDAAAHPVGPSGPGRHGFRLLLGRKARPGNARRSNPAVPGWSLHCPSPGPLHPDVWSPLPVTGPPWAACSCPVLPNRDRGPHSGQRLRLGPARGATHLNPAGSSPSASPPRENLLLAPTRPGSQVS